SIRIIAYDHRGHGGSSAAPMSTYRIDRLAADLDEVLTALNVTAPLTLVGHSMGAMVALAYLSRRACERAVDPHGLVLVATAAGKLGQRGLGRLLGTPATPLLFKVIGCVPDPALKMLAAPVCATLSRWCCCGPAQRATLRRLPPKRWPQHQCQPPLDSCRRYVTTTFTGPWARCAHRRSWSAEVPIR